MTFTSDTLIRSALKENLEKRHSHDKKVRILEEFGVLHGRVRIDVAVVNGIMHGYEIKSDQDTLQRLPEQMNAFNSVFNKMTLVVGKNHLYDAINIVPEWWGITVAKFDPNNNLIFNIIREPDDNNEQDSLSIARLLWRDEALRILEEAGAAHGLYSKPRHLIYKRLSTLLDQVTLAEKVRETIFFRANWRSDSPLLLNGG